MVRTAAYNQDDTTVDVEAIVKDLQTKVVMHLMCSATGGAVAPVSACTTELDADSNVCSGMEWRTSHRSLHMLEVPWCFCGFHPLLCQQ